MKKLTLILVLGLFAVPLFAADERLPLDQVFADVHLAHFVRRMNFSESQLQSLLKIAKPMDAERMKLLSRNDTPELRATLEELRKSIIEEAAEEKIDALHQKVQQLTGPEEVQGHARHQLMLAAQASGKEAVKVLSPGQIARLLGDEAGDPAEQLMNGIRRARSHQGEPREFAAELPNHLARLLAGGDAKKEQDLRRQLGDLVMRAIRLTDNEFGKQEKQLSEDARRVVEGAAGSSINLLQLMAEGRMTELLMNPRFTSTLEARQSFLKLFKTKS